MLRGRNRGRGRGLLLPDSTPRVPDAGDPGPFTHPDEARDILPFGRTPRAPESAQLGRVDAERHPWLERTPEPGSATLPGQAGVAEWLGAEVVPDPADPGDLFTLGEPAPNPREDTRVEVPDSTWQYAREMPFVDSAFPADRLVAILNIKEGPGWVDVKSPNIAGARFHFVGVEDLVGQRVVVTTGPAGFVSVWVGEQGTQIFVERKAGTIVYTQGANAALAIDDADGTFIATSGARIQTASFQVRYHAAKRPTSGGGPIQSRSLNSMPLERSSTIGLDPFNLGYPPLGREMFISHSEAPLIYSIMGGSVAAPIVHFTSAAVTAITLDVPADSWIRVESTPGPPDPRFFKAHWRDIAAVPQ